LIEGKLITARSKLGLIEFVSLLEGKKIKMVSNYIVCGEFVASTRTKGERRILLWVWVQLAVAATSLQQQVESAINRY
jgi:hypothetical protein